jgi:septal ring factor EnvC (AmiA/AmiB activator)
MSFPQGTAPVNIAYFNSLGARVDAVGTCASLKAIQTQAVSSVNATIAAVNSEIAQVQQQSQQLLNDIADLTALQLTLSASQASITAVGTIGATAAGVSDLGSAIAYIKAQGASLVAFGSTNTSTFIQQAKQLVSLLVKIKHDSDLLVRKIATLESQLVDIPSQLAELQAHIAEKASHIPDCTL